MAEIVFLGLGSNLGDRLDYLSQAKSLLEAKLNTAFTASRIYETKAWGKTDQPDFLNCCLMGYLNLTPEGLLATTQQIENQLGRQRTIHWGPRTIDIDILSIGSIEINLPALVLPHPAIAQRRFVLQPWADLASDYIVPQWNQTVTQLLTNCQDAEVPTKCELTLRH